MTPPSPPPGVLSFFIPCELRNYANHGGHWTGKAGYQKRLREKAHALGLKATGEAACWSTFWLLEGTIALARVPKSLSLEAHVWNYFDTHDGLRNACKPLVDGLVRARVIHSDAHDCGHQFLYTQVIDRQQRGVLIQITPREGR